MTRKTKNLIEALDEYIAHRSTVQNGWRGQNPKRIRAWCDAAHSKWLRVIETLNAAKK